MEKFSNKNQKLETYIASIAKHLKENFISSYSVQSDDVDIWGSYLVPGWSSNKSNDENLEDFKNCHILIAELHKICSILKLKFNVSHSGSNHGKLDINFENVDMELFNDNYIQSIIGIGKYDL